MIIKCRARKEIKCKQAPDACTWDTVKKECNTKITTIHRIPMDLFDVSTITDPFEIIKYVYNFLNKHSKVGAQIYINDVIFLFTDREFTWENNMCTPHFVSIVYIGNYINHPSSRKDVDHEGVNAMTTIINKHLRTLREPNKDFLHLFQPKQLTLEMCYFIQEFINYMWQTDVIGGSPQLLVDDNMNGFVNYAPCEDFDGLLYDIMQKEQLPLVKLPFLDREFRSQATIAGYTDFFTASIYDIRHATYIPNYVVRDAYVSDFGSKELNISMALMLFENEQPSNAIISRILVLLKEFKMLTQYPDLYDESYIVYHGTTQKIHSTHTFVTTSFFSTTRSIDTAIDYGNDIYVVTVPKRFPVLNFYDILQQILLPIGTVIKIDKTISFPFNAKQLIFCHIMDEPVNMDPFISIFENPVVNEKNVTISEGHKKAYKFMSSFLKGADLVPTVLKGSSVFFETQIGDSKYIIKDIIKASNKIHVLNSDNQVFKRILNELLAAHIYTRVFKLATFDYTILDKRKDQPALNALSNYLIVSKAENIRYDLKQSEKESIYTGFFVDCILANWDVYNNENVGMKDDVPIRTDVGGALAFRGRGDEKINFIHGEPPDEHYTIASQPSFKALNITNEKYVLALKYLRSISTATVLRKLHKINKEFTQFIDLVQEKENAKKYHALLQRIIQAVIYRNEWYRHNAKSIIGKFANNRSRQSGGTNEDAITPISVIVAQVDHPKYNLKELDDAPMAFTSTPAEFKRILARHQRRVTAT